jgi:hypothetical protein
LGADQNLLYGKLAKAKELLLYRHLSYLMKPSVIGVKSGVLIGLMVIFLIRLRKITLG